MIGQQIVQMLALSMTEAMGVGVVALCTYSKVKHGTFDPRPMLRRKVNEYVYLKRAADKVKSEPESERCRAAEGLWNQLASEKILVGKDLEKKKIEFFEQCGLEVPEIREDSCHDNSTSQLSCDPKNNAMIQEPEVREDSCHDNSTSQLSCDTKNNAMIQEPEVREDSCHNDSTSQLSCDLKNNAMLQEMAKFVKGQPEGKREKVAYDKWEELMNDRIITEDNYDGMKTAFYELCGLPVPKFTKDGYWGEIEARELYDASTIDGISIALCSSDSDSTTASDQDSSHNDSTSQLSCDLKNNAMLQEMAKFVKGQPEGKREKVAYDKWEELMNDRIITEDNYDGMKTAFYELCGLPVPKFTKDGYWGEIEARELYDASNIDGMSIALCSSDSDSTTASD